MNLSSNLKREVNRKVAYHTDGPFWKLLVTYSFRFPSRHMKEIP